MQSFVETCVDFDVFH